jgi:hypothetical protein
MPNAIAKAACRRLLSISSVLEIVMGCILLFAGSDQVRGNARGHAEEGDGEWDRQGGMQQAADDFVALGKCHGANLLGEAG